MIVDWFAAGMVGAIVGSVLTDAFWTLRFDRALRDVDRKLSSIGSRLPMFDATQAPATAAEQALSEALHRHREDRPRPPRRCSR